MRDLNITCPQCHGFGCVDDDPEVPGSTVECPKCNGAGGFVKPCCEDNDDGLPKCDGSCLSAEERDDTAKFSDASLKEATKYETLGPAYFEARTIVEKKMADFEAEHFKPLIEKFTDQFREKLWDDVRDHLLGDTQLNLQGEMYRMVDACINAILSGERWAIERYALGNYRAEPVREAIAKYIPAELQDARIADLEEENKRLKETIKFMR